MSLLRIATVALAIALVHATAGTPEWLPEKRNVHLVAVTDTAPAGAALKPPTVDTPAYYIVGNMGYQVFGADGPKERPPEPDEFIRLTARVLANHGYRPTSDTHPPSLLLVWAWGTMNADVTPSMVIGEGPDRETRHSPGGDMIETGEFQTNWRRLARFLGGAKVGLLPKETDGDEPRPHLFYAYDTEVIRDLAKDDLYVMAIAAYDFSAWQQKRNVLLWTTRIACPAAGLTMTEALPALITLAAPYVGRETPRPVSIWSDDRHPQVTVGEPTVVQDEHDGLPRPAATKRPAK